MTRPNYDPRRKAVRLVVDNDREGAAKLRKGRKRRFDLGSALATDAYVRRQVPITLPKLKFLGDK